MPPRVLVDATAVPADRGGVGRYVDGLIPALARLIDAPGRLVVACQRADADRYGKLAPLAEVVSAPTAAGHRAARLAWEQTGLPLIAQRTGAEVIHCPDYTMPLRTTQPVVVTIHEVTFFSRPELYGSARGGFHRSAIKTALRRAARCIVPSKATRDELVRLVNADAAKIDVAYHGVDPELFHPTDESERARVSRRLGLHGAPYVAFLGELSRRKNVPNLVRGYVLASEKMADPPALVLAGSDGNDGWDDEVDAAIADVPERLRIVRPGYLRFADLPGFLNGAEVVAIPSEAEGFGLPVLEAMACGAPVLTTRMLALPEVGGDAVAYAEPSAEGIAASLSDLLADEALRGRLAAAGLERAREFVWDDSARAHLAAYERALAD